MVPLLMLLHEGSTRSSAPSNVRPHRSAAWPPLDAKELFRSCRLVGLELELVACRLVGFELVACRLGLELFIRIDT